MADQEREAQAPLKAPDSTIVTDRVAELTGDGAVLTDPFLSCATEGQADIVYDGRRWLLGINDETYQTYVAYLERANIPHIENDTNLGTSAVFMGEIPRSARTIDRIIYSRQPPTGMKVDDVFFDAGKRLAQLASQESVLPTAESFSLSRIMAYRSVADVLFLPPFILGPASHELQDQLIVRADQELAAKYEQFGRAVLLHAFRKGLEANKI